MNLQISNNLLNKETRNDFFLPRSFYQAQNRLFFIANYVSQTYFSSTSEDVSYYSALELTGENGQFSVSDEVCILKVNNETEELVDVFLLDSIPEKEDQDEVWIETFEWLFIVLRNERGEINATYSKDILPILYRVLKQYAFKTSVFRSGKEVEVLLLDGFKITAEATTGYYEGNLLLTNWKVIERYSEMVIAELKDIQLPHQLFIEEDDSEDSLLEALVDAISREDIISFTLEALEKGVKQEVVQYENKQQMEKNNEGNWS